MAAAGALLFRQLELIGQLVDHVGDLHLARLRGMKDRKHQGLEVGNGHVGSP